MTAPLIRWATPKQGASRMSAERITCPACGRNVLIRQDGAIQNHGITRALTAAECRLSGVSESAIRPTPKVQPPMTDHLYREIEELKDEIARLQGLINTPHTADFLTAVQLEATHQRERWAAEHDAGKTDADWFWLIGYLAGKALHKPDKQLHHIITTAAALLNWHAAVTGNDTRMRPGIAEPK